MEFNDENIPLNQSCSVQRRVSPLRPLDNAIPWRAEQKNLHERIGVHRSLDIKCEWETNSIPVSTSVFLF